MNVENFAYRGLRKETYRQWFEYLRLAMASADRTIQDALKRSRERYAPWGDVRGVRFDDWWKTHQDLFEEPKVVVLPKDPANLVCEAKWDNSLVLEVPLNQSITKLAKQVVSLLRANDTRKKRGKAQLVITGTFPITEGAEPKLGATREYLSVYKNVVCKHPELKGRALLEAVHSYYRGRKKRAAIPGPLHTGGGYAGDENALRSLNRYIHKAEKIIGNVARGEFPGRY